MKKVLQIIHSEVADISVISKFFQKSHHTSTIFYKNLRFLKKKELDQFDLFIRAHMIPLSLPYPDFVAKASHG